MLEANADAMRYDVRWSCAPEDDDAREVLKAYEYARAHTNVSENRQQGGAVVGLL